MARNQQRIFSESDSLHALSMGRELDAPTYAPQAAAQRMEEERQAVPEMPETAGDETDASAAAPASETPAEEAAAAPKEETEQADKTPKSPRKTEKRAAPEPLIPEEGPEDGGAFAVPEKPEDDPDQEIAKWAERERRAQRVDPDKPAIAREAWAREDQEAQARKAAERPEEIDENPDRKKKTKDGKKKSRKKKNKPARDDRRSFVKSLCIICICGFLFVTVALMVVSNFLSSPLLALPRQMVTKVITPVQSVFSQVTDSVVGYLRMLKIRGNIEYEYEQLSLLLDDYANQSAQLEELRRINESLYDLLDEQERNRDMNPLAATVIGTDSGNYFSTLTLDVGSKNGVEEYMAVVAQGGLVGVTYNVEATKCQVRCVIDSDCTVAALIQSSRDQGSVKGTLGINGEAMCRMYYLPDNSLPRPGDMVVTSGVGLEFPKGIPIGQVRESTRGMEDNKSYVVLEPIVDFQHLEYVTVYRYKPSYAEAAQARSSSGVTSLEPLSTPRPVPTFQVGAVSDFIFSPSPSPSATPEGETPAPDASVAASSPTPAPEGNPTAIPANRTAIPAGTTLPAGVTAAPAANPTAIPANLEYQTAARSDETPSPTPRPTFTPTPSPAPTPDPGGMTVEEE